MKSSWLLWLLTALPFLLGWCIGRIFSVVYWVYSKVSAVIVWTFAALIAGFEEGFIFRP